MRPSKARSELSVGLACNLRWVTYEGAVHSRPARQPPEVEAGFGKAARPVLCGGRIAICVPTAIFIFLLLVNAAAFRDMPFPYYWSLADFALSMSTLLFNT